MRETSLHIRLCGWLGAITVLLSGVIDAYADLSDGLVAHYSFSNGSANDESGNGNHGVITGASLVPDMFGDQSGAVQISDTTSFVEIAESQSLTIDDEITLSAWVKANQIPTSATIVLKGMLRRNWDYGLSFSGTHFLYEKSSGSIGPAVSALVGTWYHILVSISESNNTIEFYLNGMRQGNLEVVSGTFNPNNLSNVIRDTSNGGNVLIGNNNTTGEPGNFNGVIDNVRIYNRALTAEEALMLYQHENLFSPFLTMRPSRYWITMHVTVGRRYQLETSIDMTAWEALGEPFTAVSNIAEIEEKIESARKFYRIVELPR